MEEKLPWIVTVAFGAGFYVSTLLVTWSELKRLRTGLHDLRDAVNNNNVRVALAEFETEFLRKINGTYVRMDVFNAKIDVLERRVE